MPWSSPGPARGDCAGCRQADEAEIRIGDVVVTMTTQSNLDVPAEFSAFIPRAEIRRRFQDGRLAEEEIILSSITIVHSPRHRAEKENGNGSVGPRAVWVPRSEPKVTAVERAAPRLNIGSRREP